MTAYIFPPSARDKPQLYGGEARCVNGKRRGWKTAWASRRGGWAGSTETRPRISRNKRGESAGTNWRGAGGGEDAERRSSRYKVEARGAGKVSAQTAKVGGVEGVVDVFGQVGFESGSGQGEFACGGGGDFFEVLEAEIARSDEVGDYFRGGQACCRVAAPCGPDGQDSGKAGHGAPLLDVVVDKKLGGVGSGGDAEVVGWHGPGGEGLLLRRYGWRCGRCNASGVRLYGDGEA